VGKTRWCDDILRSLWAVLVASNVDLDYVAGYTGAVEPERVCERGL
jgi:hypothetical protein